MKKVTKTTKVRYLEPQLNNEKKNKLDGGIHLLYGKDLKEYENIPIDELLNQLTEEELEQLSNDVDPDDSHIPPSMRCREQTKKGPTGPLDRKKLLEFLKNYALAQEDWPEDKPFQPGVKKGKQILCVSIRKPTMFNHPSPYLRDAISSRD